MVLDAYHNMIENQLRAGGIFQPFVFDAFQTVDRSAFVPDSFRDFAFADMRIPIGHGQQMSFPQTDALVFQAAFPKKHETVLEIGTGTGFTAALLASCARFVTTVEIQPALASLAQDKLMAQDVRNLRAVCADGLVPEQYLAAGQKFDLIVFSGAVKMVPERILDHLADQGRMVVFHQLPAIDQVELMRKRPDGTFETTVLFETAIEPLVQSPSSGFVF